MTPSELNKAIRRGEIFWVPDPDDQNRESVIQKGKSLAGKVKVKRYQRSGWLEVTFCRRAGSFEPIPLSAEGAMTWAIN